MTLTSTEPTESVARVAKTLYVPPDLVRYINWDVIGQMRTELRCDMRVTDHKDGGVTIRLEWPE